MRKLILAGITVLLATFFVTCDALTFPGGDDVVEYTDVEYSEDGSFVTVYLDGSKPVPVTRAQRAMTTNLAKMAYDYIEVLFVNGSGATQIRARSVWELGQSAGISGVDRGTAGAGVNYSYVSGDTPLALMFVGRKDNKTLLGIGQILQVDRLPKMKVPYDFTGPGGFPVIDTPVPPGTPPSYTAYIDEDTRSVTFWVEAVKTGLLIKDEAIPNALEIAFDSFPGKATDTNIRNKATRASINNSRASFPLYPLPLPTGTPVVLPDPVKAQYIFGGGAETFKTEIILDDNSLAVAEKRFPRYMDGGRYLAPQSNVDTETTVEIDASYTDYDNKVPLVFTLKPLSYGIFSFYVEVPVYLYIRTVPGDEENTAATNGGPDAVEWKIRTGLGSELYSLDDGRSSGGCVLMGVGVSALDWLEIYWNFLN